MDVVLHLTEAESEAQQAADLVVHLASHSDPAYVAGTAKWDIPKERPNDSSFSLRSSRSGISR